MTTAPANAAADANEPDSRWGLSRAWIAALLVILVVSFAGVFDHSLWTPDEPRDAEVGREMLVNHDYVVPTMAGQPFLEKPPLAWWVMAGFYRIFGVSDGVARSASALAGVLTLLLVFDLARRLTTPFGALMAVASSSTLFGFFHHFHRVVVDPWLAFFVMLGYWAFVILAFKPNVPSDDKAAHPSPWGILLIYLAAGLAFLVKGLVGPMLIGGPIVAALLYRRQWSLLRSWAHLPGVLIFLGCAAVWPLLLYHRGGAELMNVFLVNNLLYRIAPPGSFPCKLVIAGARVFGFSVPTPPLGSYTGGHEETFWYYLVATPPMLMPWFLALPAVVSWFKHRRMPIGWNQPALLFLASILPISMILLSLPATKREMYLLPAIPPVGIVLGAWIAASTHRGYFQRIDRVTQRILLIGVAATMAAAFLALPFARYKFKVIQPLSAGVIAALALFALATLVLFVWGMRLSRRDPTRVGPLLAGLILLVYVFGGSVGCYLADYPLNLHRLTADLKRVDAFSPALAAYRMDEVTRSIIPYDTGIIPTPVVEAAEAETLRRINPDAQFMLLTQFMQENPHGKVLLLERNLRYIPDATRTRLRPIQKWLYSKQRAYGLYDFAPAAGAEVTDK